MKVKNDDFFYYKIRLFINVKNQNNILIFNVNNILIFCLLFVFFYILGIFFFNARNIYLFHFKFLKISSNANFVCLIFLLLNQPVICSEFFLA